MMRWIFFICVFFRGRGGEFGCARRLAPLELGRSSGNSCPTPARNKPDPTTKVRLLSAQSDRAKHAPNARPLAL